MTGSALIQIAIAFVFIFTLFSLLCSVCNEWITRWLGFRRKILESESRSLLPAALPDKFNAHPLIQGLFERPRYPEYIPPSTFALALIDLTVHFEPGEPG